MMTKEEAIDLLINDCKNEGQSALGNYCNRTNCNECAFSGCSNDIVYMLTDRLIKAEEAPKAKTNFDHYVIKDAINITKENDCEKWYFSFKKGAEKEFLNGDCNSIFEWLLSPYEKPKYKLTQFEYDLFDSYCDTTQRIKELWTLKNMQDKGYLKGIPTDIPIKDILDNCEVVE